MEEINVKILHIQQLNIPFQIRLKKNKIHLKFTLSHKIPLYDLKPRWISKVNQKTIKKHENSPIFFIHIKKIYQFYLIEYKTVYYVLI